MRFCRAEARHVAALGEMHCARAQVMVPIMLLLLHAQLCLVAGCSSDRVPVPDLSPSEAAKKALAEYDANGDGYLDAKELERCPALKDALKTLDRDGDGRLSAEEIADRIRFYQDSQVGIMAVVCQVLMDGRPLSGATVTFVPERFLGPAVRSATGVSDANGLVQLQAEGQGLPGVHCGFFRIEVSKKNAAGREIVPAKYNAQTVLGQEVAPETKARVPGSAGSDDITIRLTSK